MVFKLFIFYSYIIFGVQGRGSVCDVHKYDRNRRNCGWKGITKTECENRECCFDDSNYRNFIPTYDCHYPLDMPKCSVHEREDCGYRGISYRECVKKLHCCWDSTVPNVPWCFNGREKIGRCTVSERTNCGFNGIAGRECVVDRGCCWDSSKRDVPRCFFGKNQI